MGRSTIAAFPADPAAGSRSAPHEFLSFLSVAEKRHPGRPLMGSTCHPADDPVRFAPHPGMGFPAGELKCVEYDEDDDNTPPVIRATFMGMYGVDSPCRRRILMTSPAPWKGHDAMQGVSGYLQPPHPDAVLPHLA